MVCVWERNALAGSLCTQPYKTNHSLKRLTVSWKSLDIQDSAIRAPLTIVSSYPYTLALTVISGIKKPRFWLVDTPWGPCEVFLTVTVVYQSLNRKAITIEQITIHKKICQFFLYLQDVVQLSEILAAKIGLKVVFALTHFSHKGTRLIPWSTNSHTRT